MNLLKKFNDNDKKYGIDERHILDDDQTLTYVNTQITEMKAILTRLRVDILLNQTISVEGKAEKQGRDKKIQELGNDVDQFVESINALTEFRDQLVK